MPEMQQSQVGMTKDKQQILELIEKLLDKRFIGQEAMRASAAEAIQSLLVEKERLREAAQPFADSVNIDPTKKRGERHWATVGTLTNLDHVLALKDALKGGEQS